jgi:hypothetical protein
MVLILGALVILLQIVLTILLLKSDVIHKSRLKRGAYRRPEEEAPAMADNAEDAYANVSAYEAEELSAEDAAQDEGEDAFYYASVNTENEFSEENAEDAYFEATTYSLDETTGELYEDPTGEYTEELFYAEASMETPAFDTAEDGAYVALEEEGNAEPVFLFDDDDVVYGDPAEPPYEDDAVQGDPEENPSDRDQ